MTNPEWLLNHDNDVQSISCSIPVQKNCFCNYFFYSFGRDATIPYTYRIVLKILETLQIEQSSGIDQSRVAVKPWRCCAKYRHRQRIAFVFFLRIWL